MSALSRRTLISGVAIAVPMAVPAIAAAAAAVTAQAPSLAAPVSDTDPRLLALGEQLKVVMPKYAVAAERSHDQHEALWKAAGWPGYSTEMNHEELTAAQDAARERYAALQEKSDGSLYDEMSRLDEVQARLRKAIFKIPANDPVGIGIHAAAALADGEDAENCFEMKLLLWQMAATAGFRPPAEYARRLKRSGIALPKRQREEAKHQAQLAVQS